MFNWFKTAVLMAGITGLFVVVGGMIGGEEGMFMALLLAFGMNFFSYWFSDKMVLKMMNAKVAYSKGREHVDVCFEKMFTQLINQIKDPKTLKNAKLFMEAFLGFYKALEK